MLPVKQADDFAAGVGDLGTKMLFGWRSGWVRDLPVRCCCKSCFGALIYSYQLGCNNMKRRIELCPSPIS